MLLKADWYDEMRVSHRSSGGRCQTAQTRADRGTGSCPPCFYTCRTDRCWAPRYTRWYLCGTGRVSTGHRRVCVCVCVNVKLLPTHLSFCTSYPGGQMQRNEPSRFWQVPGWQAPGSVTHSLISDTHTHTLLHNSPAQHKTWWSEQLNYSKENSLKKSFNY